MQSVIESVYISSILDDTVDFAYHMNDTLLLPIMTPFFYFFKKISLVSGTLMTIVFRSSYSAILENTSLYV
jgi:hypothetical protein